METQDVARIAVFVSGGGTNLQALLDSPVLTSGRIVLVIADNSDAYALTRAKKAGVNHVVIPRKDADFEARALTALRSAQADMVVLAGFLGILSAEFIEAIGVPILNVHPSLIPSFCGRGFYGLRVHKAALEAGVKVSGATVHFVNSEVDGGAIIAQKAVCVEPDDTPQTLQARIMEEAEWQILPEACELVARDIVKARSE